MPQAFEEVAGYGARQIQERFDLARLNRYCEALGIRRPDSAFYTDESLLIEQDLSRWPKPPSNTLPSAQWRRQHR
jgi:hypothetical protein